MCECETKIDIGLIESAATYTLVFSAVTFALKKVGIDTGADHKPMGIIAKVFIPTVLTSVGWVMWENHRKKQ